MDDPLARAVLDIVDLTTGDSADSSLNGGLSGGQEAQAKESTWASLTTDNSDNGLFVIAGVTINGLTNSLNKATEETRTLLSLDNSDNLLFVIAGVSINCLTNSLNEATEETWTLLSLDNSDLSWNHIDSARWLFAFAAAEETSDQLHTTINGT